MPDQRTLALQAIPLLEQAIQDEFGLRVMMGAELEYVATPTRQWAGSDPGNPLNISYEAKTSGEPPRFFENSHFISAHYKETPDCKYELVFTHENHGALALANAIEATKKLLKRRDKEFGVSVSFDPYFNERTTNGLHLNASLIDDTGRNVFNGPQERVIPKELAAATLPALEETQLLHAPHEDSYRRYYNPSDRISRQNPFMGGVVMPRSQRPSEKKTGIYLEFLLAGADADPHLAVMATLLGIYTGLKDRHLSPLSPLPRCAPPTDRETAIGNFERGTLLRYTLNMLSHNHDLGDRLHHAILENARRERPPEASMGLH